MYWSSIPWLPSSKNVLAILVSTELCRALKDVKELSERQIQQREDHRDGVQLRRDLPCDDSQHAALTERIKVAADTLHIRPNIRRIDGHTQICLGAQDGTAITDGEVTLAARIEDFYRTVVQQP